VGALPTDQGDVLEHQGRGSIEAGNEQRRGLDFDNEDRTSTLEHLSKDKFIQKYASFMHTTISHRIDAPRARVVFLLDKPIYQAKNYAAAASALVWFFAGADRQCKDAARFFYGSPSCDFVQIGNELPLAKVKELIAHHQDAGEYRKPHQPSLDHAPAEQAEVASALQAIPPWGIDYEDWVTVLMAIHAEFGDAGLPMAESWADGKNGEVAQKWRSFKPSGNGAGRVGIGSLFNLAIQNGWRSDNG